MDQMLSYQNSTGPHDWTQIQQLVQWAQMLMALLSALGSASIIACMASQRPDGSTAERQAPLLLAASDLLLALCWLLGGALGSQHCLVRHHLHMARQVVCMASFFYTLNYVWSVYANLRLRFSFGPQQHLGQRVPAAKMTALLCGVLPVILMAPVFIRGSVGQCTANCSDLYRDPLMLPVAARQPVRACLVLRIYSGAIFLAAFFLTLVGMMMIMGKARHVYRRVVMSYGYLGNQQRASFRSLDFRMLAFPLVFALCWGPAACLVMMSSRNASSAAAVVYVIQVGDLRRRVSSKGARGQRSRVFVRQAFTSPSQGVFHSVLLACARTRGRGRLAWRDADTQTPLLRAQKRNYRTWQ
ncbi:transmembrane protein 116-like isoform X2 [Nerophis lumbriciformis]|uniref:transmembrane protein 116-like isoform X2 n=1 Tax=Nerophis lumbriciformis TaxID=546530 RepID=UPI002ADF9F30|nr:transmembrane protein 116-like isoform X2 [Nerophis lumbriciformis]